MFHRILVGVSIATLCVLLLVQPLLAGGWTVVTLDELPLQVRAGEPMALSFQVMQHGVRPLELAAGETILRAWQQASSQTLEVAANATGKPGHYVAEIVFPVGGVWHWEVRPGGFPAAVMPDLLVAVGQVSPPTPLQSAASDWERWRQWVWQVVSAWRQPAAPAKPTVAIVDLSKDPVAYGKALFVAKGCATCHRHGAVTTQFSVEVGPDLTSYQTIPAYVTVWLRDPKALKSAAQMPTLPLQDSEIEALIAFLGAEMQ